jgi:hypothetical protein
LQLRLLQTVVRRRRGEQHPFTPLPVELLWFFDRLPGLSSQAESVKASAGAGNGHGAAPLESEEVPAA